MGIIMEVGIYGLWSMGSVITVGYRVCLQNEVGRKRSFGPDYYK